MTGAVLAATPTYCSHEVNAESQVQSLVTPSDEVCLFVFCHATCQIIH